MRTERWRTVTVLALCLVAAMLGASIAKNRADSLAPPNPWVRPK